MFCVVIKGQTTIEHNAQIFEGMCVCRENVSEKLAIGTCLILMSIFVFKGTQINQVPIVMRQPLDLFRFFTVVQERGGLQEVSSVKPVCLSLRKRRQFFVLYYCFTDGELLCNVVSKLSTRL